MSSGAGLRDERLPSLALALDAAAMQPVFEASLFSADGRCRMVDSVIERTRYKPGENCLVCYRLRIEDQATHSVFEQLCSARVYERGGSSSRYARAAKALAHGQGGQPPHPSVKPLVHLPELEMVVWAFPNDRKLSGLPRLTDADDLQTSLLPPLVTQHLGSAWRIAALRQAITHYNPEHTCMVRVELQVRHIHTGEQRPYGLYGKTYHDDAGAETHRVMSELWGAAAGPGNPLWIAQPLGYQPELKLLWQRGLPGQPLLALGLNSPQFQASLERAAAVVAALHRTSVPGIRRDSVHAWMATLQAMRAWLPRVRPSCQPALEHAVAVLLDQAGALGEQPAATLHGDLHPQNFCCDGQRVALIDLDNVYHGSPWQDVGSFVASLLQAGMISGLPPARTRELAALFCAAYRRHVPWRISDSALNWFVAAALINERAFRCVTRLKDGRLGMVDTLVALAAQIATGVRAKPVRGEATV